MPDDCLFCRMSAGLVPVEKLHDEQLVFAIADINPRAPVHALVIPREHIASVQDLTPQHGALLAALYGAANEVARGQGLAERGYRCTFNVGADGGQTVYHLHLHVLGGRRLGPEG
jgi:histidine triad (HIT) family protein